MKQSFTPVELDGILRDAAKSRGRLMIDLPTSDSVIIDSERDSLRHIIEALPECSTEYEDCEFWDIREGDRVRVTGVLSGDVAEFDVERVMPHIIRGATRNIYRDGHYTYQRIPAPRVLPTLPASVITNVVATSGRTYPVMSLDNFGYWIGVEATGLYSSLGPCEIASWDLTNPVMTSHNN